ncbi:hypothetical protein RD792_003998 [Penstemon davidsonii]|uniref:DUF4005 domain-containing protein n=1 Tax=Penstemon davidsonii TaxID=160366 RepID=A0ABR0DG74_9LAMI|nr:hypothetical protein RD792_003998 [Penstemon davidsonii]
MGKASKWFRGLLGLKKPDPTPIDKPSPKKKWSFAKSKEENPKAQYGVVPGATAYNDEAKMHAIAVATATARAAEAAVAAAQAAAVAVKHSSRGLNISSAAYVSKSSAGYGGSQEEWAAVMIQSHFRAYLSRRALRALKALVKLQALVRGHLMRKRTADALRQLQALVRAQTRARVGRVLNSESPQSSMKSSHLNYHGPDTPEKVEHVIRARSMNHEQSMMLKRNGSKSNGSDLSRIWMENQSYEKSSKQGSFTRTPSTHDEKSDKILEVDTGKPKRRNLFPSSHLSLGSDQICQSFSTSKDSTARSGEVQSLSPLKFAQNIDESAYCTANNTPTKSDGSRSYLSGFPDNNPSYMAYTESSKAKLRSVSAPRQRPHYERSSSNKRYSVHGYGESRSTTQRVSEIHANFTSKVYPGSGRLDRLGMPVRGDSVGFSGGLWHRY